MNNNPFLQSKQESKRFRFLDSEKSDQKISVKDKKNSYNYESSNNSFTKTSSTKTSSTKTSSTKTSYNKHDYNPKPNSKDEYKKEMSTNHFREIVQTTQPNDFIITDELFPSLTPISTTYKNNPTNFKDALKHQNTTIVNEDITLKPGWVQISRVNNKTVISQEKPCPYDIKMQQMQTLQKDPNYIMNKTIESMQTIWLKYKINYDNIYGEGAYDDLHYLSPVYDSDDDEYDEYEYEYEYEDEKHDNYVEYIEVITE